MMIAWPKTVGWIISLAAAIDLVQPLRRDRAAARARAAFGEPPQAVLDDDDRAVDDQAEVDRAEAHQVAADPSLHHAGRRHQHRERDRQRGDQRGAEVAQQQEQHER